MTPIKIRFWGGYLLNPEGTLNSNSNLTIIKCFEKICSKYKIHLRYFLDQFSGVSSTDLACWSWSRSFWEPVSSRFRESLARSSRTRSRSGSRPSSRLWNDFLLFRLYHRIRLFRVRRIYNWKRGQLSQLKSSAESESYSINENKLNSVN